MVSREFLVSPAFFRLPKLHAVIPATTQIPKLSLVSRRFEEVVSKIAVIFEQGPDGHERGLDALSDGQQSLSFLPHSLPAGVRRPLGSKLPSQPVSFVDGGEHVARAVGVADQMGLDAIFD